MRTGITLCHHLWRNAVDCEETLVVADAQEDQGFDHAADVTEFEEGDGTGNRDGEGYAGHKKGYGYGYGAGSGDEDGEGLVKGFGFGHRDGDGFGDEDGDGFGNGFGDGDMCSDGSGGDTSAHWASGTPYPFPDEAQEAPCDTE